MLLIMLMWNQMFVSAGEKTDSTKIEWRTKGLPVLFYSPEMNWGFGLSAVNTIRFPNNNIPSQIQLLAAYTLNKQLIFMMPFSLSLKEDDYRFFGEAGYYIFSFNYYGLGYREDFQFIENYGVDFPRIRLNLLKKLDNNWFIGTKYWFEDYRITNYDLEGELITGNVPGSVGGITSGLGLVTLYDSRNEQFWTTSGSYIEMSYQHFGSFLGSDFNINRYELRSRYFYQLPWKHVIGFNYRQVNNFGTPPFNLMATLGGAKVFRGYYDGRLRDMHSYFVQTEYRAELKYRFSVVGFGGIGAVSSKIYDIPSDHLRLCYGAGLRFALDKKEKVNLRFDVGFSKLSSGYYVTIGEAF